MKKETVQQGREGYGKREMALVPVISKFKANRQGLPILETIVETYSLLLNVRICVHEGPNGSNSPVRRFFEFSAKN